jgi:DNA-binding PadR family transcriptional regulator
MHHHPFHHHFGRHHGGRGFGHFGRGFMDGGEMGSRAFGMGRKLASVDLQLLILGLLEEKPRHGYEIIKALDERTKGFYVPSPGMVYPALTYLEEIGHATVEVEGARKLYHITSEGNQHLDENRSTVEALFKQFDRVGERMEQVRRAMGEEADEGRSSREERKGSKELQSIRKELKAALAATSDSPREEQQRVVDILQRALAQILSR